MLCHVSCGCAFGIWLYRARSVSLYLGNFTACSLCVRFGAYRLVWWMWLCVGCGCVSLCLMSLCGMSLSGEYRLVWGIWLCVVLNLAVCYVSVCHYIEFRCVCVSWCLTWPCVFEKFSPQQQTHSCG